MIFDNNISLVSDTTFKYLMKNERSKKWLLEIISKKTGIDLSDYSLIDNELNTGGRLKDYRMDLIFKKDDDIVIIEMNNGNISQSLKGRYYLYRMAGNRFAAGENYKLTTTKLIMFNNYCNDKLSELKLANYTLNDKNNNLDIEDIEIYEIYLPNYHKMCYDKCDEIEKRLWLFSEKDIEEMKRIVDNEEDNAIIEELERLSMDLQFAHDYDHEKVNKMLMNTEKELGKQEGIIEGEKNKAVEIAKKLLQENISIEKVSEITSLSIEEIQQIKNEIV